MAKPTDVFWNELAKDLEDPEFLRDYIIESIRIDAIDNVMNKLESARDEAGISKAELARATNMTPASLRRLLSSKSVNPTIGTLAEIAAVLGYEVGLVPLSRELSDAITVPLRTGKSADTLALARQFAPR